MAVAIIFSCWVSALALSTVPAYWNRWKTATACELDEIFTPQYITCIVPPLFSTVMVALTILYWRIGKEARAQLSRLLGADGKGPPWRRSQSGKTYCSSLSSNENQRENDKILNPQANIVSKEHGNSSESLSQSTKSGFLTRQDIMQSHALPETGYITEEGGFPNHEEERCKNYYENANNFHTLYKIEEESDIIDDDDESGPIPSKGNSKQQYNQHTIHIELYAENLGVNNIDEHTAYSKRETIDDQILQTDNKVPSHILQENKKPKETDISISATAYENSFTKSSCSKKCIARAIQNLKGHFDTITLDTSIRRIPFNSKVSAAYDPCDNPCKFNNTQPSEKKEPIFPNETNIVNNQQQKLITQASQYDCQKTNEPTFQDFRVNHDYVLKNSSDTTIKYSHTNLESRELILCVNSLDLAYDKTLKSLGDIEEEDTIVNKFIIHNNTYNANITKDLPSNSDQRSRLKLENEIFKTKDSTMHNYDCKIQNNLMNLKTSIQGEDSEEAKKEKPYCNDFQAISEVQKDKNEHQSLKTRSLSCSSQDDPRSNPWTIRFPSLASAGTTVRPISKSTIVVLLVLGSFLLLWLPYITVCGLLVNGYHLPYNIYRATFSLAMSNSGVNPIIYGWKNAELKRVFLRFILKKWHKCQSKYKKAEQATEPEMELQEFTTMSMNPQKF